MRANFRLRLVGLGTVCGSLALLCATATAQTVSKSGARSDSDSLVEITVTATKRDESIQAVPTAVTALTGDEILRQGLVQFTDYMDLVPGLAQNNAGAAAHGLVILRGLSTGAQQTAATVSFMIDDVPFTANESLAIGSLLTPDPDLTDIQRIEILKGPQGTLYGASALGGLIKIVSNQPTADEVSGEIHAGYESVDHGGNGYSVRGTVNIPLVQDKVSLRISAYHRDDPGFMQNVTLNQADTNRTTTSGGKAILRIQATDNLDIRFTGLMQNLKADGSTQVDVDAATLKPIYCQYCYASPINPVFDTKYRLAGVTVNWTIPGAGTLTNSLSYGRYTDFEAFDYTREYGIYNLILGLPVPANTAVIGQLLPAMEKVTEELRFATVRFGNFEGLAGLFYTNEQNRYNVNLTNQVPPTMAPVAAPFDNFLISDSSPDYKEYAVFGNLTYYFLTNLDLTVGARYSHNKQHDAGEASGVLNGLADTTSLFSSSESSTTYLATLRYRPAEELDTYARVATGYRPGGPQLTQGANVPLAFKKDTTTNYEVGAKGRWFDGHFTSNVALYYISWKDIQLNELIGGLQYQGNGGKATSKGLEVELAYIPIKGLTTQFSGSWNRAITNVAVPNVGALAGDTLPYAPRFNGSALIDYDFPIGATAKANVGATYAYQGSRPSSWSQDPLNLNFNLPSYTTVDVRTGVNWDRYSLELRGSNIFDKRAFSTSYVGNIFPGQGVIGQAIIIQPRTISVDMGVKF
jgi:outer membrane receptor protein involved in Fe transport